MKSNKAKPLSFKIKFADPNASGIFLGIVLGTLFGWYIFFIGGAIYLAVRIRYGA